MLETWETRNRLYKLMKTDEVEVAGWELMISKIMNALMGANLDRVDGRLHDESEELAFKLANPRVGGIVACVCQMLNGLKIKLEGKFKILWRRY